MDDSIAEDYQRLTAAQIMADLGVLGRDELLLVKSLEEAGAQRVEVLATVNGLLSKRAATPPPEVPDATDRQVRTAQQRDTQIESLRFEMLRALQQLAHVAQETRHANDPDPESTPLVAEAASPRRERRRRPETVKLLIALGLVTAIIATGVLYLRRTASSGSTAVPSTAAPAVGLGDPSGPRILADVKGYTIQPATDVDASQSDLSRAVNADGGTDGQAALIQDGFEHGYQQSWTRTFDRQVVLFVYQFKNASGAAAYGQRWIGADRNALKGVATDYTVPGVPGSVGLHSNVDRARSTVVFTHDRYLVRVVVSLSVSAAETDLAKNLAVQQYRLL